MKNFSAFLIDFCISDNGVTAIEYALIAGLIFVVIVGAVGALGTKVVVVYQSIQASFP